MSNATSSKQGAISEKFLVIPVIVLILAQMGTSGENSAMSLSATVLAEMFGCTTADFQLANMVYSLVAGALMIAGGMMGVIIGWKKNFRIGALLCAAGEVVVALSPNMMILTWGGRILVGLGASFMIPSLLGLVPYMYHSGKNRALAFGCIGAATGIATVLPILFGVLLESLGFRVTFGILAVYFVLVFAASFALPPIKEAEGNLKFDYVGTGLAALGLFLFLVGISRLSVWGLVTATADAPFSVLGLSPALVMAVVGLVVLAVLIVVERKIEAKNGCALLPQSFYKNPQVLSGVFASFQIFFASAVISLLLLPFLQRVVGWSAVQAALIAVAMGVPMFLFAMGIPKLMPALHPRRAIQAGYILIAAGLVCVLLSLSSDNVNALVWVGSIVLGIGLGCLSAHASNVVALAINDRDAAQSGGVQTTSRNVGYAISIAALGAVLLLGISSGISSAIADNSAVSAETKAIVASQNIDMMSDTAFREQFADVVQSDEEMNALVQANSDARLDALRMAFIVGTVFVLASLLTTPAIRVARKEDAETQEETAIAALAEEEDLAIA
ncbi:MAG TPA: MFS transporter [Adlercreutzia equolifaciens]|uniref:MFS transporter n=1 Tax=Adlercreutzia equolifaciens TaxID=446660 RepID=UPI00242FA6BE|nr:MFS transporter [Adlercreutzia equolifaciens]HJI11237.1 MFS transporter [Adlercreutzia equolifaciens]